MRIRKVYFIIFIMLFILSAGCFKVYFSEKDNAAPEITFEYSEEDGKQDDEYDSKSYESTFTGSENIIYVFLCGAVVNAGVYELPEGSRLVDAVILAGGMSEEADKDYNNQARVLSDGERVYFPTKKETEVMSTAERLEGELSLEKNSVKVNINTASVEELVKLSGIGESKARAIISFRNANGAFTKCEDLIAVPGIGEALFLQISSEITIGE